MIWILGNIVGNVAGRLWQGGNDLADLTLALQVNAISDFADLVAAALIIWIILRIQGWADAREPGPELTPPAEGYPIRT